MLIPQLHRLVAKRTASKEDRVAAMFINTPAAKCHSCVWVAELGL